MSEAVVETKTKTNKLAEFFRTHGWCKGVLARDVEGNRTLFNSEDAVSFCLLGGSDNVYGFHPTMGRAEAYNKLKETTGAELADWNDNIAKSKEEVIALCEKAGV